MSAHERRAHRAILGGLFLGALAGVGANALAGALPQLKGPLETLIDGAAYPVGQVFLRMLFLVIVPLVFASLAAGVARLGDLSRLGRIGALTMGLFFLTTAFSVALGLAVMGFFQPGVGFDEASRRALMESFGGDAARFQPAAGPGSLRALVTAVLDSVLPRNILAAVADMRMLPLILFALLFGSALTALPEERRGRMTGWLDSLSDAMVAIVGFAMRLAPVAVFCLIFTVTARFGFGLLAKLAFYVVLVFGCYLLQLLVFYPFLVKSLAGLSGRLFMRRTVPVIVTAFSTSSSNATLPTTMRVAETELGVRPAIAGFVCPLGATINMNGTALFEGAVVLFVAQVFGIPLSLPQQALVVLLCVLSAVGTAGIPGGSIPLLMGVMAQVGVPPDGIALILGADRLLDMGRTVINVEGDLAAAVCVEAFEARREAA
ncbi:MAG TPA: dicarboxylate/amino acid:cation symporter [Elusimicrobia bacterium]|nr:dicarboxylate/amino acid:cation symporter [Elusimicrobiota bacterium]